MLDQPYFHVDHRIEGENPHWVIICDHASNRVPFQVNDGDLGLPEEDMARHIAFDPGAAGVTRALAQSLSAPAILSNFSRLVIDPNRGEDDPTLLMRLYDGSIIPANRKADRAEKERRLDLFYRPYHQAVTEVLAEHPGAIIVSVHSYARQLQGRAPRPWHIGLLYSEDSRLAHPLLQHLLDEEDICVGDNQPYSGHLHGDTMDRHGVQPGRPHILIELRNDLIATLSDQIHWAQRLAPILRKARADMVKEMTVG